MRLLIASLLIITCTFAADISEEFSSAALVPDVVTKAPNDLLSITFKDSNGKEKDVTFGEELTPTLVKDPPLVAWYYEDNTYYTLAMVDPDVPSRQDPKLGEMLHWLVVNIQGGDMTKGETIADYIGSGPGKDTGLHRYVLLVYKQPEKLTIEEARISNRERAGRPDFTIYNFAMKYKLGDPVSGNMFLAQYDDYVPVLQKQLGDSA